MIEINKTKDNRRKLNDGFSLVELICVIAIISLVIVSVGTLTPGVVSESQLNNDAYKLADLVQKAKATALSQNTYVWMTFSNQTVNGAPCLYVALEIAKNGQAGDWANNSVQLLTKIVSFPNLALSSSALAQLKELPIDPLNPIVDVSTYATTSGGGSAWPSTSLKVPGKPAPVVFNSVVAFAPDGEIFIDQSKKTHSIGIGLQAGSSAVPKHFIAGIRMTGLGGQIAVYR